MEDDEAGAIATPNGSVKFVSVVGATRDEYAAAQRWRTTGVIELLRTQSPALITDVARKSVLEAPDNAARVEAGLTKDGSNCGMIYLDVVEVTTDPLHLTLGARGVRELQAILPYRLPFGGSFGLIGTTHGVSFKPGAANGTAPADYGLDVTLDAPGVRELLQVLQPRRGDYRLSACPGLTITVVPSETRDRDGNVTEVIG